MDGLSREYPFYQYMSGRGGGSQQPNSYLNFQPYIPTFIGKPVQDIAETYKTYSENLKYLSDVQDALDIAMSDAELAIDPIDYGIAENRKNAIRMTAEQIADSGNFRAAGLLVNKALKDFQSDTALRAAQMRKIDFDKKLEEIRTNPNYTDVQKEYRIRTNKLTPTIPDSNGIYPTTVDVIPPVPKYDLDDFMFRLANNTATQLKDLGFTTKYNEKYPDLVDYWYKGTAEIRTRDQLKDVLRGAIATNPEAQPFVRDLVESVNKEKEDRVKELMESQGIAYDADLAMEGHYNRFIDDLIEPYIDMAEMSKIRPDYAAGNYWDYYAAAKTGKEKTSGNIVRASNIVSPIQIPSEYTGLDKYVSPVSRTEFAPGKAGETMEKVDPITGTVLTGTNYLTGGINYGVGWMGQAFGVKPDVSYLDPPAEFKPIINRLAKIMGYSGEDVTKESLETQQKVYPQVLDFYSKYLKSGSFAVGGINLTRGESDAASKEMFNTSINNGTLFVSENKFLDKLEGRSAIHLGDNKIIPTSEIPKYLKFETMSGSEKGVPVTVTREIDTDNPYTLYTGDYKFSKSWEVSLGDEKFIISETPFMYDMSSIDRNGNPRDLMVDFAVANVINTSKYTKKENKIDFPVRRPDGSVATYYLVTNVSPTSNTDLQYQFFYPDGTPLTSVEVAPSGEAILNSIVNPIIRKIEDNK